MDVCDGVKKTTARWYVQWLKSLKGFGLLVAMINNIQHSALFPSGKWVRVSACGNLFRVQTRFVNKSPKIDSRRGVVSSFSSKSRKRLIDILLSVDLRKEQKNCPITFITLTYPQDHVDPVESKRHLSMFLRSMRRRFPGASGVWRMEFQRRGSVHYHLLVFNLPFWRYALLNEVWSRIIGSPEYVRTEIKAMRSWRGVASYASKYVAKCDSERSERATPKRASEASASEAGGSLVYDPYLSDSSGVDSVGRFWGVFNRRSFPSGVCESVWLPMGSWFFKLRRCAKRFWRGVRRNGFGFSIFSADAVRWAALAVNWFHRSMPNYEPVYRPSFGLGDYPDDWDSPPDLDYFRDSVTGEVVDWMRWENTGLCRHVEVVESN